MSSLRFRELRHLAALRHFSKLGAIEMSHQKPWGAPHPGCVVFLLDQSSSMERKLASGKFGEGSRLADAVATVLNKCINEIGKCCQRGGGVISPRAEIAVIGYGAQVASLLGKELAGKTLVKIDQLMDAPLDVEQRDRVGYDDAGSKYTFKVPFNIWVRAVANGGTPMCAALQHARSICESWVSSHAQCHPPIVINITDGDSTDGDPLPEALRLRELKTDDGELLLFNCHLSPFSPDEVRFPGSESDLPKEDDSAAKLFAMSSVIPETMRTRACEFEVKKNMKPGDRGFLFNTDVDGVMSLIQFATVAALQSAETGNAQTATA